VLLNILFAVDRRVKYMSKSIKVKFLMIFSISVLLTLVFLCTSISAGKIDQPSEIQQKLMGISDEEKKVLEDLFNLTQEIEVSEVEEKSLSKDIEVIKVEIKEFEARIKDEEASYGKNQEGLKQVLMTYQRMGPGSYLEIIMDSDSITTFLRRINILRDLTRNTGELLDKLEASRKRLTLEKTKLNEKLVLIEDKQKQVRNLLSKKLQLKKEREEYLASLKENRKFYEEQLLSIQKMIEELKPFLLNATDRFYRILEEGTIPPEAVRFTFSLAYIKEFLDDKVLNEIMAQLPDFPKMEFTFHPGRAEMNFPEKNLTIFGNFIAEDGHLLKFQVQEGTFHGMPLEARYIKELFSGDSMSLDCEPMLQGSILESVETKEGHIEMTVKINIFDFFN
jgi:peptidoglycan hydrolase CwlO-like protein